MEAEDYRSTYEAEVEAAKKKAGGPASGAKRGGARGPTTASLLTNGSPMNMLGHAATM